MAGHRPQKRFGQHFLFDPQVLDRIVALVGPRQAETIIEIGPGQGVLTLPLAKSGARVIAVEFDRDLIAPLTSKSTGYPNLSIVQEDFLLFEPDPSIESYAVAGNIPYNITSPIVDWCARHVSCISRVILMMQREMARRICGEPSTKDWAPISIMTQISFDTTYEFEVPPSAFTPPPEVHSAVIRLVPRLKPPSVDLAKLDWLVHKAFEHRRKLLVNNLVPDPIMTAGEHASYLCQIEAREDARAEQLSIEQFVKLTGLLAADDKL